MFEIGKDVVVFGQEVVDYNSHTLLVLSVQILELVDIRVQLEHAKVDVDAENRIVGSQEQFGLHFLSFGFHRFEETRLRVYKVEGFLGSALFLKNFKVQL